MPFESLFGLVFVIIVLVVVGSVIHYLANASQPTVTRPARVVAKRIAVTGFEHTNTSYYCTFEFDGGDRREYSVGALEYGMLAEGDEGELDTRGVRFWAFRRKQRRVGLRERSE